MNRETCAMLHRACRVTGLALTLDLDPAPRNPRLAEEPLFHLPAWHRAPLGDPHDWPTPRAFLAAMRGVPALILDVKAVWRGDGLPHFSTILRDDDRAIGYAFATHERLRLHFGVDALAPEHLEEAALVCDTELLAYEELLGGDVHAFTISAPDGRVLERQNGLFGLEQAEFRAERAFEDCLARWGQDEERRPAA